MHRLAALVEQRDDSAKLCGIGSSAGRSSARPRSGEARQARRRHAGARPLSARRVAIGGGAVGGSTSAPRRRGAAVAAAAARCAGPRRGSRLRSSGAHQLGRRRQIGDIGEAHQHHLGGLDRRGRGLHLAEALEQHLPGARQHRHRQLRGQRPGALAVAFGHRVAGAGLGRELQPGQEMRELEQILHHQQRIGAAVIERSSWASAAGASPPQHRSRTGRTRGRGRRGPACRAPPLR